MTKTKGAVTGARTASAPKGPPGRAVRVLRRLALLAALLVALTACASKGMPPAQRAAAKAEGGGQAQQGGGSSAPSDPDAAKKEITALYTYIFDGANPEVDGKIAKVNRGEAVRNSFVTAMTTNASTFAQLSARVDDIQFESAEKAKTKFTLSVAGVPTLEGFEGVAVNIGGKWYLEAQGLCDLVALADASLPCNPN